MNQVIQAISLAVDRFLATYTGSNAFAAALEQAHQISYDFGKTFAYVAIAAAQAKAGDCAKKLGTGG